MHIKKIESLALLKSYSTSFLILLFATLFAGCASSKKIIYFQDEEGQDLNEILLSFQPTIQKGDILTIIVTSTEPETAAPFNIYEGQGTVNSLPLPYIVNFDGEINFPVLGKILVTQLTTNELTDKLTEILTSYLKKPIVNTRIINFNIRVLGEVASPGSYPVLNERASIIDAIALAGDLTIYGNRKTITLIREQNGKRAFIPIDLTNKQLFNSPYFYLVQNDVIYVEPNKTRVNSAAVGPSWGVFISSLAILITVAAILTR
jgi:polysaccharide export outer membrane protein